MTATLTQIRQEIANNVTDITGLSMQPRVLSNPTPPCGDVRRGPFEYDQAMALGLHRETILVRVFMPGVTDAAQDMLDEYTDPAGGIKAAIESDGTLGGLVDDLRVTGCTGDTPYTFDGQGPLLGSEWTVEVWL